MATLQKEPLWAMTPEEQAALERLVRSSSERVDRVQRATALLAVGQGQGFAAAARQGGFASGTSVAELAARFHRRGLAAVSIAAGCGREPTDDPAARARTVATAQRAPEGKTDGTVTWSLSTLERTLRREGWPRLGAATLRRVLQDADSSYRSPAPGVRPARPSVSARAGSCG
jgi:hypothetical protein